MYDHETYLSPLTWRYGSAEMRRIWSERQKRLLWRRICAFRLNQGDSRQDAALYATFTVLGKAAQAIGVSRLATRVVVDRLGMASAPAGRGVDGASC